MLRIIRISLMTMLAATLPVAASGQEVASTQTAVVHDGHAVVSGSSEAPATFNGYSQYRQHPDLGAPGSAAHGFFHFNGPLHRFGTWYRPRAATLTRFQRCAPDPFRPRGLGHLFAEPCDGFRMEYSPYKLHDASSQYGPSYLARMPDERCEHCDKLAHDNKRKLKKHQADCQTCR
jgi:hypothetical protein